MTRIDTIQRLKRTNLLPVTKALDGIGGNLLRKLLLLLGNLVENSLYRGLLTILLTPRSRGLEVQVAPTGGVRQVKQTLSRWTVCTTG